MAQTHSLDLETSSSQYADAADSASLDITGSITIEAWIKTESSNNNQVVIWKGDDSGTKQLNYVIDWGTGGAMRFYYVTSVDNDWHIYTLTNALENNVWQHIAVTYTFGTASTMKFYVNGLVVGGSWTYNNGNEAVEANADTLQIGAHNTGGTRGSYFDGLIKDVRIFDDIRTAAEIASDAAAESVSNANLQAEWNLNNAYTDASGNSNTLTGRGSPVFSTVIPWESPTDVSTSTNLTTNLTSYYSLEEASGSRVDETANSYDLTDNNTVTSAAGKQGDAAVFTSANSEYFTGSQSIIPYGGNVVTINFWSKLAATGGNQSFVMIARTSQGLLAYKSGTNSITFSKPNVVDLNYTWTGIDTNWHMWTFMGYGNGMRIYLDGVLVAENTNTGNFVAPSTDLTHIGAYSSGGSVQASWYQNGTIDELAFYSNAISYGDIIDLYNGGSGLAYVGSTAHTQTVADSVALTDTSTPVHGVVLALSDSITLSDSISQVLSFGSVISESISLSDVASLIASKVISVSESITLSDSSTFVSNFVKTIADSLTLSDTSTQVSTFSIALYDTLTLTDSVTPSTAKLISISESISLSDSVSSLLGLGVVIADTLNLSDVAAFASNLSKTFSESLTLTDSSSLSIVIDVVISETLSISDSVTAGSTKVLSVSEILTLSDSSTRSLGYGVALSDTITLTDSVLLVNGITISETLSLSDSVSVSSIITVVVTETLTLLDKIIKGGWSWVDKNSKTDAWSMSSKNSSSDDWTFISRNQP